VRWGRRATGLVFSVGPNLLQIQFNEIAGLPNVRPLRSVDIRKLLG
jgi:hypothetical protein